MVRRSRAAARKRLPGDKPRRCVDCGPEVKSPRQAPYAGPRCFTHDRAKKRAVSAHRHAQHVETTYGITDKQYAALLAAQGGVCYGCGRKPGRKRLAVDHRHSDGLVRGLLCRGCNRNVLGHFRDSPEALRRLADYLENPPALDVIGRVIVPEGM